VGFNGRGIFSFVGYNGEKLYNKELYFKILSASHCLQTKI
jgi:hypothetical protein